MLRRIPQSEFLGPDDLALCQRVFDQICTDANWDRDCPDSQILASVILAAFQHGTTNEAELLAAMRERRNDFEKRTG